MLSQIWKLSQCRRWTSLFPLNIDPNKSGQCLAVGGWNTAANNVLLGIIWFYVGWKKTLSVWQSCRQVAAMNNASCPWMREASMEKKSVWNDMKIHASMRNLPQAEEAKKRITTYKYCAEEQGISLCLVHINHFLSGLGHTQLSQIEHSNSLQKYENVIRAQM